jgi:hypothetical protein
LTVEIRGDGLSKENIHLASLQRKLPEKVKQAVQAAMDEAADEEPPADRRLDQVLDRLEKIERQLRHLERQKASSHGQ